MTNGNGHAQPHQDLLVFPCRIDIKAIGIHSNRFQAIVLGIVSRHIEAGRLVATASRESRGGKYLAVTVSVQAQDREEVDAIYRELTQCKDVLIAL
ncbi:MAG: DUF493 domain-containing protein [Gammaproteobacteria bacterium]|nr:DUF493 domain-containing protein [Gammaproteobacteria bacterium]